MYYLRTVAAVHRGQRLPAGPRRPAPSGHDRRPGLARGQRGQAVRARRPCARPPSPSARSSTGTTTTSIVSAEAGPRDLLAPRLRTPHRPRAGARNPADRLLLRRGCDGRARAIGSSRPTRRSPGGGSCSTRRPSVAAAGRRSPRPPSIRPCSARGSPSEYALVLKVHPNVDAATLPTTGYDVLIDPTRRAQRRAGADRHPGHGLLLGGVRVRAPPAPDGDHGRRSRRLRARSGRLRRLRDRDGRDAGLDTDGVAAAILEARFDLSGYDAFIERHMSAPATARRASGSWSSSPRAGCWSALALSDLQAPPFASAR